MPLSQREMSFHFNITEEPSHAAVMEMLNNLPGYLRDELVEKSKNLTLDNLANSSTNYGLRQSYHDIKSSIKQIKNCTDLFKITSTNNSNTKPKEKSNKGSEIDSFQTLSNTLKPIVCQDLQLNTVHKDRYLFARVTEGPGLFTIRSIFLLLEDMYGTVMKVCIYNVPNAAQFVAKLFPLHRKICIVEPFYKMFQDGSIGIRVDDPNEIIDYPFDHFSPMENLPDSFEGNNVSLARSWR